MIADFRLASVFSVFFLIQVLVLPCSAQDLLYRLQSTAVEEGRASWGYWGTDANKYSTWTNHSNRLIPIYTFGMTLASLRDEGSAYASESRLQELYGVVPEGTLRNDATYFDQTDVFRLQSMAIAAGKNRIIVMVFDGMDWESTRNAAIFKTRSVPYVSGRGTGLSFQDYDDCETDYGYFVTSAHHANAKLDVDAQLVLNGKTGSGGGYDADRGGIDPWSAPRSRDYLIGKDRDRPHNVTDSAASATSMTCGIKTYNGAINVSIDGQWMEPIGRRLQREKGYSVGIVTNVPISHATPACGYANNVTRKDYQDITRDLLGLPSSSHRDRPLPGVDVLIGAGWGAAAETDDKQGNNFAAGNTYMDLRDIERIEAANGGNYIVTQRHPGRNGTFQLRSAAKQAVRQQKRLFGFFGTSYGHLPYRTADGKFNPAPDVGKAEAYGPDDIFENPTLADMAEAALEVLSKDTDGFWLMVEAGDVDWANHSNNIDNSVGAVISGELAFDRIVEWVSDHGGWSDTVLILTSDHGHYFTLTDAEALTGSEN